MSQGFAAHQGAGDASIAVMEVAHDQVPVQMHDGPREAITKPKAMKATASSTSNTLLAPSNDLDHHSFPNRGSSDDIEPTATPTEVCVTTPPDLSNLEHAGNGTIALNQVIPPEAVIVRPSPLASHTPPPPTPSPNTTTIEPPSSTPLSQQYSNKTPSAVSSLHVSRDSAAGSSTHEGKMVFGHGPSRPGASQRRRNFANTNALTEQEADLTSKDRAKQREAVAKYIAENVKDDWTWEWPPLPAAPVSPTTLQPTVSELTQTITEQWKERDEWTDNASEGGEDLSPGEIAERADYKEDPYRFESPDGVGDTIKKVENDRKRRRKKRIADEMTWNDGLHCFIKRRDAWTGARRISRSPNVGMTPIRKQRTSASSSSEDGGSSTAIEQEEESDWEADTEIPIAPPFLPPENTMRASIGPNAYSTIYDKIILNQMTPLCPINLKDVTRSCVKGWQRDGEWPPKPNEMTRLTKRRTLSLGGLLGFDKPEMSKDKEKADGERKSGERSPPSPSSTIGSKLGKMLHLKKKLTKEGVS